MNDNNVKERRSLITVAPELTEIEGGTGRSVSGYAAIYDEESDVIFDILSGEFTEVISRGAFDGVVEISDVMALLNHNISRGVLARSRSGAGSLKLTVDDKGLKYEFESPNTVLGDELLEGLRRGDINASSFCFEVAEDEWDYTGELPKRTIKKFSRLYDVSPVYTPAYAGTSVSARCKEMATKNVKKEEVKRGKTRKGIKYKYL